MPQRQLLLPVHLFVAVLLDCLCLGLRDRLCHYKALYKFTSFILLFYFYLHDVVGPCIVSDFLPSVSDVLLHLLRSSMKFKHSIYN